MMEGWLVETPISSGRMLLLTPPGRPQPQYLEVKVQNPHLVHEEDPIADLPDKHHGVHLGQLIILIHNPLEELAALDAACTDPSTGCFWASDTPTRPPAPTADTHYSMNRMISCEVSKAAYSWIRLRWFSWFITSISSITISWGTKKSGVHPSIITACPLSSIPMPFTRPSLNHYSASSSLASLPLTSPHPQPYVLTTSSHSCWDTICLLIYLSLFLLTEQWDARGPSLLAHHSPPYTLPGHSPQAPLLDIPSKCD